MAQTIESGLRDVVTAQGTTLIPPQIVQNKIDLLTGNDAPWTLITRAANKKKAVGDWTFYIYQDLLLKRRTTLAETATVADATWVLAAGTGDYVASYDILWNRTRNVFVHVKSISTDTVTVLVNCDGGTDTQGEVGDEIWILGNSMQEAGALPTAKVVAETRRTNYVTDVETVLDYSDMAMYSDYFFEGKDIDYQRMKAAIEHQRKLEMLMKLGPAPKLIAGSGTYVPALNSTYGIGFTMSFRAFMNSYADTNHIKTDTDLTENEFINNLEHAFFAEDEGQNKKKVMMWCAQRLATGMTKWNIGRNRYHDMTSKNAKTLGLNFRRWETPFGPVDMVIDHELQSSVSGGIHYYFLVNPKRMGYVPYKNLDTHMVEYPQTITNPKRKVICWRTVFGTWYTQENDHLWGKFSTVS